ncbi:MAG: type II toxin-antitoxin system prevent-host-death family antitoxin [Acidimicrobiia bacterium]
MESIGLRELRQNASELVRRAEQGEELLVTVAGRPAAVLGPAPAHPTTWRRYSEVKAVFAGPADADWEADRALVDNELRDPW